MTTQLIAYSTFALAVSLSVSRPLISRQRRLDPAIATGGGVAVMLLAGVVSPDDVATAARELWRPMLTIVSIMVSTAVAHRLGVLRAVGARIFADPTVSARTLFLRVFVLSAATSTVLNNDAAVLLLTPLVLALVHERFPGDSRLSVAFAFAVFSAIGVAPFVISNPMNMIVASHAELDFNEYAARMLPITLLGWMIAFPILRRIFAPVLDGAPQARPVDAGGGLDGAQKAVLAVLVVAVGLYPLMALFDTSLIWVVAAAAAGASVALAWRVAGERPVELITRGVAWNVLAFLGGVFVLAIGLRNAGFVDLLAQVYAEAGTFGIGAIAALGSAVGNNHPMASLNMLALDATPGSGMTEILAALVGGDLGPRLLPSGSLAGLLWLEACRRQRVEISLAHFAGVGAAITVPTLVVSLAILQLR